MRLHRCNLSDLYLLVERGMMSEHERTIFFIAEKREFMLPVAIDVLENQMIFHTEKFQFGEKVNKFYDLLKFHVGCIK